MEHIGGGAEGPREVRDFYGRATTVGDYCRRRFHSPIGSLLHHRQSALLRELIERQAPRSALEVACGPGRLTGELVAAIGEYVALDASLAMLVATRERLRELGQGNRCRAVVADAFASPLRQRFDLVLAFRFLRHFGAGERQRLLSSLHAQLRKGGTLSFDAVNEQVSGKLTRQPPPGAPRVYDWMSTASELHQELAMAGFEGVHLTGILHAFPVLRRIQILVAPRSRRLAAALVAAVDRLGRRPLEWIVTCQRK